MSGSRSQLSNIEDFVRENTSLITRHLEENPDTANVYRRIYKCKDCDKEYDNFQALGGHRASHRSIKTEPGADGSLLLFPETSSNDKTHECRICKKRFSIGQALGGHMRKHWQEKVDNGETGLWHEDKDIVNELRICSMTIVPYQSDDSACSSSSSIISAFNGKEVFKYDLNLTPEENESMNAVPLLYQGRSQDS